MGTRMDRSVSNSFEDIQGLSQSGRLQSMDTPLTTEAATRLRPFCTVRRVVGQLMLRPAKMALVCMWFTMTCRAAMLSVLVNSQKADAHLEEHSPVQQEANKLAGITF